MRLLVTFFLASDKQGCWRNIHAWNIPNAPCMTAKRLKQKSRLHLAQKEMTVGDNPVRKNVCSCWAYWADLCSCLFLNVASCPIFFVQGREHDEANVNVHVPWSKSGTNAFVISKSDMQSTIHPSFERQKCVFLLSPTVHALQSNKSKCTLLCVHVWHVCFHEHFHRDPRRIVT